MPVRADGVGADPRLEGGGEAVLGVGRHRVGLGPPGRDAHEQVVVVEPQVDLDGGVRVVVDRPTGHGDGLAGDRELVDASVGHVQAPRVVVSGRLVGGHRVGATRFDLPRGDARDEPAHDRAEAGDGLVALAVAELVAPGPAVVAVPVGAVAGSARAVAAAHARPAAAARATARVAALHVVAGTAAEPEPSAFHQPATAVPRRAGVGAVDRAAELGVAVAAAPHAAALADAGAHGRRSRGWPQQVVGRCDGRPRCRRRRCGPGTRVGRSAGQAWNTLDQGRTLVRGLTAPGPHGPGRYPDSGWGPETRPEAGLRLNP